MRVLITCGDSWASCMPEVLTKTSHTANGATYELQHWSEHRKASGDDGDVGFDGRPDSGIGIVPGDVHLGQFPQEGQSINTRRCYTMFPD